MAGINAVSAAVEHDADNVREVLIEAGAKNPRLTEIEESARRKGIDVRRVAQNALDGVTGGMRHQGVVARYAAAKTWDENELPGLVEAAEGKALILVLDGVQDPHNLGACLRVADGVGAHAVIVPKDRAVGLNATAAKVASGAAETVPYITVTNLARTMRELKERDIMLIGTSDDADRGLYEADFTGPAALVMGGEGEGMRRLTRETCDILVSIPMFGSVESLNVSVASGVCLYEARRQRIVKEG
ncbi:MAG: 23S rRNA (guanosine(2251)-2'-O)-methyltransferase RlmB [Telluria sp.]